MERTDVVYAVDSSRRIDEDMFNKMKQMVKASLKSYRISPVDTRAAVVVFGGDSRIELSLNEGTNLSKVESAIDGLTRIGGPRRMNKALRKISSDVISNPLNRRENAKKIVILLTTGKNSGDGTGELPSVALDLRSKGVEVIALVIGKEKDPKEIDTITGRNGNAVYVDDITKLPLSIGILEAKAREGGGNYLLNNII